MATYQRIPCVYIMSNKSLVLYIGVTSNLVKRVYEHKNDSADGFTRKYKLYMLIYYEVFESMTEAISREKQLKNWHREWKLNLVKTKNPDLKDLYSEIILKTLKQVQGDGNLTLTALPQSCPRPAV